MQIIVMRHAKVAYKWHKMSTAEIFHKDCVSYDHAPLSVTHTLPIDVSVEHIYVSSLRRSQETAALLFPQSQVEVTSLLDEVPLNASCQLKIKMPLYFWYATGRWQWLRNHPRQKEGSRQTRERARCLIAILKKKNQDCLLVTHGFFMQTLKAELKKQGFQEKKEKRCYVFYEKETGDKKALSDNY